MAAGDNVIVSYQAGDETTAATALSTLAPIASDKVITWQHNNLVYVAKIATA